MGARSAGALATGINSFSLKPHAQEDDDGSFVTRVRMMSADIKYGCEYLGNSGRLVVCALL